MDLDADGARALVASAELYGKSEAIRRETIHTLNRIYEAARVGNTSCVFVHNPFYPETTAELERRGFVVKLVRYTLGSHGREEEYVDTVVKWGKDG